MKRLLAASLSLFSFHSLAARAADECPEPGAGERVLVGRFMPEGPQAWKPRRLPLRRDVIAALDKLDYGDELPRVHEVDLNDDARGEQFVVSPERLCGNGGCPYVLLAAGNLAKIGEFFGHLALLDERVNGYRIIQSYSHSGAGLTNLDTYAFDGTGYRLVAQVVLQDCGFEQWKRRMRK